MQDTRRVTVDLAGVIETENFGVRSTRISFVFHLRSRQGPRILTIFA